MASFQDTWRAGGTGIGDYDLEARTTTQTPLTVRGAASHATDYFVVEQSDGTDLLTVDSSGNITITNDLTVSGSTDITIDEAVTGSLDLTGDLTVTGTSTFNGNVDINGSTIIWDDDGNSTIAMNNELGTDRLRHTVDGWDIYDLYYSGIEFLRDSFVRSRNDMTIEADGTLLINSATVGVTMFFPDDITCAFGNTIASPDATINWETADSSAHYLNIALGTSRNIIISEDRNVDWAHAAGADPRLWIQSSDSATVADYISFYHDQTNANIDVGAGDLLVNIAGANFAPDTEDGAALGIVNTGAWSDLALASGAVIDWNNSDATLTHSANILTLDSADLHISDGDGLVVGHTAQITQPETSEVQILGTGAVDSSLIIGKWAADNTGPHINFVKSNDNVIFDGTYGIVTDNTIVGSIDWYPDDGVDLSTLAASFRAEVDDTAPAAGDIGMAFSWRQMDGAGDYRETLRLAPDGTLVLGNGEGGVTAAISETFRAANLTTGGAGNVQGADLTIASGLGTGTGDPGQIIFQVAPITTAGDTLQSRATVFTLDGDATNTATFNLPATGRVTFDGTTTRTGTGSLIATNATIDTTTATADVSVHVSTVTRAAADTGGTANYYSTLATGNMGGTEWSYVYGGTYDTSNCATATSNAAVFYAGTSTVDAQCNDYGIYITSGYDTAGYFDGAVTVTGTFTLGGDLFIEDGNGIVIGHSSQITQPFTSEAQILGTAAVDSSLVIGKWIADATGPTINFVKSNDAVIFDGSYAIVADSDVIGSLNFYPDDGADLSTLAATFSGVVNDAAPGAGDVGMSFVWATMSPGIALRNTMILTAAGNLTPGLTDGGSLGTTTVNWSDLFLDNGGVINFDSGDVTLTHSTGLLSGDGGGLAWTFTSGVTNSTSSFAANVEYVARVTTDRASTTASTISAAILAMNQMSDASPGASLQSYAMAASADNDSGGGTLAEIGGLIVQTETAASGTTTDTYGVRVLTDISGGTSTNVYGLRIDDVNTGATINNAILTGAGVVRFGDNVQPATTDGAALGTGTVMWSDLFLASGAVINFSNGDVTITHAANTLAFAGATSNYTFDDHITPDANDGAQLGVSGTAWSDLFLASGAVINFNNGDVTITHSSAQSLTIAGLEDLVVTQVADTNGIPTLFTLTGAAHTGITADTECIGANLDFSANKTWAVSVAGLAVQREVVVQAPTYIGDVAGAMTITRASTFVITGAPTAGADMTITAALALEVTAGVSAFGGTIVPLTNDGSALGIATVGEWSDLFLASGAVINFANGDVTVTHTANTLAFAGATATYTFDDEIVVTVGAAEALRLATNATDYTAFTMDANGGLTIQSVDAAAAAANIAITADGTFAVTSTGINITGVGAVSGVADLFVDDGAQIGISGNELLTFAAAGTANFTGCTVDVDGAFTATSVTADAALGGIDVNINGATIETGSAGTLNIANGTAPDNSVANQVIIYSADSTDNTAALALFTEQAVEAIGTFTASNKIKVSINGAFYWLQLDAV